MKQKGRFQGENVLLFISYLGLRNGATYTSLKPTIITFFSAVRMAPLLHIVYANIALGNRDAFWLVLFQRLKPSNQPQESKIFCPIRRIS